MKIFQRLGSASVLLLYIPHGHGLGILSLKEQEVGMWITDHNPYSTSHFESREREEKGRQGERGSTGKGNTQEKTENGSLRQWELSPSDHLLSAGLGQMIPRFCVFLNKPSFLKTHYLPTKVLVYRFLGLWLSSQLDLIYDHPHNNLTNGIFPTAISQQVLSTINISFFLWNSFIFQVWTTNNNGTFKESLI